MRSAVRHRRARLRSSGWDWLHTTEPVEGDRPPTTGSSRSPPSARPPTSSTGPRASTRDGAASGDGCGADDTGTVTSSATTNSRSGDVRARGVSSCPVPSV